MKMLAMSVAGKIIQILFLPTKKREKKLCMHLQACIKKAAKKVSDFFHIVDIFCILNSLLLIQKQINRGRLNLVLDITKFHLDINSAMTACIFILLNFNPTEKIGI